MAEHGPDVTASNDEEDESGGPASEESPATPSDGRMLPPDVQAELAVLRERNERLREAYSAARRTRHRRSALGLAAVGVVAVAGGLLLPDARTVLFALGATGLFAGILTYYLTPERFVAASVGRDVYAALADNEATIITELGLGDHRVYVPTDGDVRLFVPQHDDYGVPDAESLSDAFIVTEDERSRGLALGPTGAGLVDAYERAAAGGLPENPTPLLEGLGEALVEQFELLGSASVEVESGRATVAASDSAFGPCHRFDHPVPSVLASGAARGLDRPVELSVRASEDARADWQITCRWDAGSAEEGETGGDVEGSDAN